MLARAVQPLPPLATPMLNRAPPCFTPCTLFSPQNYYLALQSHDRRMILFVHLPGSISSEVIEITDRDTHVFHIKKAIVEAFKRFKDSDASDLHLLKLDGSSHILLNSSQTMSEAGVHAGTTLVVELAAAQVFAPPTGVHVLGVQISPVLRFCCTCAANFVQCLALRSVSVENLP